MSVAEEHHDYLPALWSRLTERVDPGGTTTIADIYQRYLPYRTVRDEVGVLEFAGYEHALLRMLAGEDGYLRVEDLAAREEILREWNSPNPILGIYRDFGEAKVQLRAADGTMLEGAPPPPPPDPEPVLAATSRSMPTGEAARTDPMERGEDGPVGLNSSSVEEEEPTHRDFPVAAEVASCGNCHQQLPPVHRARFCPFCGASRGPIPCDHCGTMLEGNWRFCIRCGADAEPIPIGESAP